MRGLVLGRSADHAGRARPGKSPAAPINQMEIIFICRPIKETTIDPAGLEDRTMKQGLPPFPKRTRALARWATEENSSLAGRWKRERIRSDVRLDQWRGTALFARERRRPTRLNCSIHRSPLLFHREILLYVGRFLSEERGKKEARPRNRIRPRRRRSCVINQSVRDYLI
jgi:hypothetical protein